MLHTRCLAAFLVAGWPAGVAPAADFAALVGQLAADDYQTRERAGAALLKAGESAIPDLKTALLKVTDPEANRRLQVLLERLESDCLAEPRRVTLKVERKPAKEVFVELARQSGYQFTFDANPNRDKALVTFDWAGTPFLQAVDHLCDVLQMNSIVNEHDGAVSVYDGDQVNPHVAYAGPFRIIATQIHSNRSLQVGGFSRRNPLARAPDSVNVNFSVQGEPKACLCALGPTTVLRATDESKNSLLLADPAAPPGDDAPAGTPGGDLPPPTFRSHSSDTWFAVSRGTRRSEFVKECRVRLTVAVLAEARP